MEFRSYYLTPQGDLKKNLGEAEFRSAFESQQGLLWVDITGIDGDGRFLERNFHFHHLAIEDCVSPSIHSPKIDDLGDYLFIVIHGINPISDSKTLETTELAIFLGRTFVVSLHRTPLGCINDTMCLVEDDGRMMKRGADFLAHALIDTVIDDILPVIDQMNEASEQIEEDTIRNPQQKVLEAILRLKRSTRSIRRIIAPQREILNRLSRGEFPIIKDEARIFYRDIYDHIIRVEELSLNIRDGADSALETYMSSVANRQNEIMKVLSMVATIFMPLTLITGYFGMNFKYIPGLEESWGYLATLIFMAMLTILSLIWFRWRRWIG